MATARLPFLYPHLFRTVRGNASEPLPAVRSRTINRSCQSPLVPTPRTSSLSSRSSNSSPFHTLSPRHQQAFAPRSGTGVQPESTTGIEGSNVPDVEEGKTEEKNEKEKGAGSDDVKRTAVKNGKNGSNGVKSKNGKKDCQLSGASTRPAEKAGGKSKELKTKPTEQRALDTVLHMEPPSAFKKDAHRSPHLQAPPYVHHFDTYTLVRDLEKGGFTQDQSVTAMKAVRGLLALNLTVAKEELVSKSDVENV